MADDFFSIAVIGGGRTGAPLLENLLKHGFVKVVGVADIAAEAPGVRLAKEKGIFTTTDYMDLARMGKDVDVVIDVSGDPKVRENLRKHFQETGNQHTILTPELVANLMMSMAKGELVRGAHGFQEYK